MGGVDAHKILGCSLAGLLALTPFLPAEARSLGHYGSHAYSHFKSSTHSSESHSHSSKAAPGVNRNSHGKIVRSSTQTMAFKRSHPCPFTGRSSSGCSGYVIDHVVPLKRGGADGPSSMQWQTKRAAKEKNKWEW